MLNEINMNNMNMNKKNTKILKYEIYDNKSALKCKLSRFVSFMLKVVLFRNCAIRKWARLVGFQPCFICNASAVFGR